MHTRPARPDPCATHVHAASRIVDRDVARAEARP